MSALRQEIVEAETIDSLADEIIRDYNGDARAAINLLPALRLAATRARPSARWSVRNSPSLI
jgi:DNA polymerase III delta prime subunit